MVTPALPENIRDRESELHNPRGGLSPKLLPARSAAMSSAQRSRNAWAPSDQADSSVCVALCTGGQTQNSVGMSTGGSNLFDQELERVVSKATGADVRSAVG